MSKSKKLPPKAPAAAADLALADELFGTAKAAWENGQGRKAEQLLHRILAITDKWLDPNDRRIVKPLNEMASVLLMRNRNSEAEPVLRRSITISELDPRSKRYGESSSFTWALNALAGLLAETGRPAEAEPFLRRQLAIHESMARDAPHPGGLVDALRILASLLMELKRPAEAEPLVRRALALYEACPLPWAVAGIPSIQTELARCLDAQGQYKEALTLARKRLKMLIQNKVKKGHKDPCLRESLDLYAGILERSGMPADKLRDHLKPLLAPAGLIWRAKKNKK